MQAQRSAGQEAGDTGSIGGQDAVILYAGAAPTWVAGVSPGNAVPVVLTVGTLSSRTGTTLAVQ